MIGTGELIVILCLALLLFGGKKLPELARSLGLGIREFKKACNGLDDEESNNPSSNSNLKKQQVEPVTLIVEPENKDD